MIYRTIHTIFSLSGQSYAADVLLIAREVVVCVSFSLLGTNESVFLKCCINFWLVEEAVQQQELIAALQWLCEAAACCVVIKSASHGI